MMVPARRRVAVVAGIFFLGSSVGRGFRIPSPTATGTIRSPQRRRQQPQHHQPPLTSLAAIEQPTVDLLVQSAVVVTSHPHTMVNVVLSTSHLLLGTDVTLHHMASVMDPDATASIMMTGTSPAEEDVARAVVSSSSSAPLSPAATVAVFVAGLVPFAVATVEFWRRVALRLPFGTGSKEDSVLIVIGDDNNRQLSRGRRVLGKDALAVAVVLFAVAAAVLAVTVLSVITSSAPPPNSYS